MAFDVKIPTHLFYCAPRRGETTPQLLDPICSCGSAPLTPLATPTFGTVVLHLDRYARLLSVTTKEDTRAVGRERERSAEQSAYGSNQQCFIGRDVHALVHLEANGVAIRAEFALQGAHDGRHPNHAQLATPQWLRPRLVALLGEVLERRGHHIGLSLIDEGLQSV
jgi:hypothetical protein